MASFYNNPLSHQHTHTHTPWWHWRAKGYAEMNTKYTLNNCNLKVIVRKLNLQWPVTYSHAITDKPTDAHTHTYMHKHQWIKRTNTSTQFLAWVWCAYRWLRVCVCDRLLCTQTGNGNNWWYNVHFFLWWFSGFNIVLSEVETSVQKKTHKTNSLIPFFNTHRHTYRHT